MCYIAPNFSLYAIIILLYLQTYLGANTPLKLAFLAHPFFPTSFKFSKTTEVKDMSY